MAAYECTHQENRLLQWKMIDSFQQTIWRGFVLDTHNDIGSSLYSLSAWCSAYLKVIWCLGPVNREKCYFDEVFPCTIQENALITRMGPSENPKNIGLIIDSINEFYRFYLRATKLSEIAVYARNCPPSYHTLMKTVIITRIATKTYHTYIVLIQKYRPRSQNGASHTDIVMTSILAHRWTKIGHFRGFP